MRYFLYIFLFSSFSHGQTIFLTNDDIKAFPTAKGYGQDAVGGRGGTVIHVTNLNATGTGSLNEAMNTSGARYIVFDVAGEIDWSSTERTVNEANCTILGQTAPSPGIAIRAGTLKIAKSEVVARFLRVRIGNTYNNDAVRIRNEVNGSTIENIVVDHFSMGWANDENLSIGINAGAAPTSQIQNVTVQNSIIHEALQGSSFHYAALLGERSYKISLIQNYWANNMNRVPEHTYGDGSSFEFVNNLLYNYNRPITVAYGESLFDSVGNVFQPDSDYEPGQANHVYQLNSIENPSGLVSEGNMWDDDNITHGAYSNPSGMTNSNWDTNGATGRGLTDSPYTPLSSSLVIDTVLDNVGVNPVFSDSVDARLIGDWTDNNGLQSIDTVSEVGGYPTYASTSHPAGYDTDGDGLSDAYEDAQTAAYGGATDSIDPNDRPAQARIADGTTIDQTGVTSYASAGYAHMDIFAADLAGDWDSFTATGSGTSFSAAKSSQAILIAN